MGLNCLYRKPCGSELSLSKPCGSELSKSQTWGYQNVLTPKTFRFLVFAIVAEALTPLYPRVLFLFSTLCRENNKNHGEETKRNDHASEKDCGETEGTEKEEGRQQQQQFQRQQFQCQWQRQHPQQWKQQCKKPSVLSSSTLPDRNVCLCCVQISA